MSLISSSTKYHPLSATTLFLQKFFDPIHHWHSRLLWSEKGHLPKSFEAFLQFIVKYHENNETTLMKNCKDHLGYKKMDNKELDDIALPFLTSLKVYTVKPPSLGYYIKKLLQSFTIITFIFRCIDGVTDFTLTATYLTNWKQVVNDSFTQTSSYNSNETMTELCERERKSLSIRVIDDLLP